MNGVSWLDAISALIGERSVDVEVSRPDGDTLAVTAGARGIVLHVAGDDGFVMPSIASGSTIANRMQERVKHFDAVRFEVRSETVVAVVDMALAHLHPR